MKKNMSKTDGIVRIIIAIVILGLWHFNIIGGTLLIVLSTIAAIFVITGFINFCPLYAACRIKTGPK